MPACPVPVFHPFPMRVVLALFVLGAEPCARALGLCHQVLPREDELVPPVSCCLKPAAQVQRVVRAGLDAQSAHAASPDVDVEHVDGVALALLHVDAAGVSDDLNDAQWAVPGAAGAPRAALLVPVEILAPEPRQLRGTRLDPFGYAEERRFERQLIADYEATVDALISDLRNEQLAVATEIAGLPLSIRGFGHVKQRNAGFAANRQRELLQRLQAPAQPVQIVDPATLKTG